MRQRKQRFCSACTERERKKQNTRHLDNLFALGVVLGLAQLAGVKLPLEQLELLLSPGVRGKEASFFSFFFFLPLSLRAL